MSRMAYLPPIINRRGIFMEDDIPWRPDINLLTLPDRLLSDFYAFRGFGLL